MTPILYDVQIEVAPFYSDFYAHNKNYNSRTAVLTEGKRVEE